MDERPEPIILLAIARDNQLHDFPVRELDIGPCGVNQQLLGEVAGELVPVAQEELFVFIDILEGPAVGQSAAFFDV
jgi:hypothetical protein